MTAFTQAIVLKIGSVAFFSIMATMIKLAASDNIPIGQIMFCRNFFALLMIIAFIGVRNLPNELKTDRPGGHFLRSFAGASAMACGFYTLSVLPLAQATVISFTAPLITVILSVFLLREVVRLYRWTAVIFGLVGVIVMMLPTISGDDSATNPGWFAFGIALLAAALMSLAKIQIRRLTTTESTFAIVFYFAFFSSLFSLVTIPFGWVIPPAQDMTILVMIGLVGGVAQLMMTRSFKDAEASVLAPFDYLALLFAVGIDIVIFTIYPSIYVILGAGIVTASGLFVIYRERQLQIERKSRAAKPTLGV